MANFRKIKGRIPSGSRVEDDLTNSLRKVLTNAGGQHARLHERVTSQWNSAPSFLPLVVDPGDSRLRLDVWLTGSEKDRMKWHSMNEGQAARVITAKGKSMIYRPGYTASTRHRKLASRRAKRYGQTRSARQVTHSQEPREIGPEVNGIINKRVDRWIKSAVWASLKRTL